MYKKILVPLDGSDLAERVLTYVKSLTDRDKTMRITFLYVITIDIPLASQKYKTQIEADARSGAESYLKRLLTKFDHQDMVETVIKSGNAAEAIVDYADRENIDLIVMATHGRSGISRWSHGSVADKVLHNSTIPVWMINSNTVKRVFLRKGHKISMLVTLDGSKLAESVLKHVSALSSHLGKDNVDVHLFRAMELFAPPFIYPPEMPINLDEYLQYEKNRAYDICVKYLQKMQGKMEKEGIKVTYATVEGNPADVIIDYAKKEEIDFIVMSTHGRTGIGRWAFGSIAEKVMQGTPCPVFLVHSIIK
jgi:nucleotide-binding universal stress UspA family protein